MNTYKPDCNYWNSCWDTVRSASLGLSSLSYPRHHRHDDASFIVAVQGERLEGISQIRAKSVAHLKNIGKNLKTPFFNHS